MKNLEEMTFEELAEHASLHIHSALLEGGEKEMKSSVYLWLGWAILWKQAQKQLRE